MSDKPQTDPAKPDLIERIKDSNPFSRNRVTGTDTQVADVTSINSAPFEGLRQLCAQSLAERRGIGAIVVGDAGMGKSHLLARLCNHLRDQNETVFAYVHNPQARADVLPRFLVKSVLGQLIMGEPGNLAASPLGSLLRDFSRVETGPLGTHPDKVCREFHERVQEILRADMPASHDPNVYGALRLLLASIIYPDGQVPSPKKPKGLLRRMFGSKREETVPVNTAAILEWLCGWPISNSRELKGTGLELDELGPSSMESVMLAIGALSQRVGRPLVLIFDQVDNLDAERAEAFAQFLHALLDHSENLIAIVAGVRERLYELRDQGLISPAAWDRIAEEEYVLYPIVREEADALIRGRLSDAFSDFQNNPEYRRQEQRDWSFPLGWNWLDSELDKRPEFRPRDVVTWAKLRWRGQQQKLTGMEPAAWLETWRENERAPRRIGRPDGELTSLIDAEISRRLESTIRQREIVPTALPPDADNIAGLIESLLVLCQRTESGSNLSEFGEPDEGSACSLLIWVRIPTGYMIDVGFVFAATRNENRMAELLEEMAGDPNPPERVILVTDARMPLVCPPEPEEGESAIKQLRSRPDSGFTEIQLEFAEHATLDALVSVYGDARSGDVEVVYTDGRVRQVTGQEVIESYQRHDRFLGQRLIRQLLCENIEPPADEAMDEPAPEKISLSEGEAERYRQHIVGHLAMHAGAGSDELAAAFRQRYEPEADEKRVLAQIDWAIVGLEEESLVVTKPMNGHYHVELSRSPVGEPG